MAIVKMKKLTLVGLLKDKQQIFDTIAATGCVHIVETQKFERCSVVEGERERERLALELNKVNDAIGFVKQQTDLFNTLYKKDKDVASINLEKHSMARPQRELTFSELMAYKNRADELDGLINEIEELKSTLNNRSNEISRIEAELKTAELFKNLPNPTSFYEDTKATSIVLGTVPTSNVGKVVEAVKKFDMAEMTVIDAVGNETLLTVVVHKSQGELLTELQTFGFQRTNVKIDKVPKIYIEELQAEKERLESGLLGFRPQIESFAASIFDLESYFDFKNLQLKKAEASGTLQQTSRTFVLQGFCPEKNEADILEQLKPYSEKTLVYFEDISEDESAPILYKNNKFVKNFEQVTNMYMPPSYHEIDPNPVMSIFYIIIFGFMLGDMGYGLVLAIAGLLARIFIKQDTGLRRMATLFGICGVGSVFVGALYGGFFGLNLYTLLNLNFDAPMPDAGEFPKTTMVVALLFGVTHLIAAYLMNMAKQLKKKQVVEALGVSLMWALFFAGAFAAVFQAAMQFCDSDRFNTIVVPDIVSTVGLVVLLASLLVAVVCSGHKKSFGGRLVSGFSSVYGLINLFGDVISYVRIFGLMLSGAMMAIVTNQLGMMLIEGGGVGWVFGPLLILAVHVFNLAMAVLGIYIHNGRLQYVEFFGKFYEGDGKLFSPFGRDFRYTLITK